MIEETKKRISVIICTYNRDKYIYQALQCLAQNVFSTEFYEIILINNNSTDQTEAQCQTFQQEYSHVTFRYFIETNQGLSHARNRGIVEAQGDILVFLDDDSFVKPDYLQNLDHYQKEYPDMAAFGGEISPLFETGTTPAWISKWNYSWVSAINLGDDVTLFTKNRYPIGANMGFKKEYFEKHGVFNTVLGRSKKNMMAGEEKDIFNRADKQTEKIYYLPLLKVKHVIPENRTTTAYIKKLGKGIGMSEKLRTLSISKSCYFKRLVSEKIKWIASLILFIGFVMARQPQKGSVLLLFRWNVTKGLCSRVALLLFAFCLLLSPLSLSAQYTEDDIYNYIEAYKGIAIKKMVEYKIPASITLAQGVFESACGTSRLATAGNNHFGIKCHKEWQGDTIRHDDDEWQECFRKYAAVEESYNDHSQFLITRPRYAKLFTLDVMDYKEWARELKTAGYATNPQYADRLISLIERFDIARQDTIAMQLFGDKIKQE
ncbi:MAG: glycosyltransferase [Lentimicrobiaceae bacterium]|nr:glycosyltransferase [Lentimicrobiaceae bacterium]